jgi:lipid II:glycine glycyltransferase (peptidoglycan interpeptide bridge formation enzyme)
MEKLELIAISDYSKIDQKEWKDFVLGHPNGNIFQLPEFYKCYLESSRYDPLIIVILNANRKIIGLQLSVTETIMDGFLQFLTRRSIVHWGPLIQNNDKEILSFLLDEYNKKVKNKAIYSQYRNGWNFSELNDIFESKDFVYQKHLDLLFDLSKGETKLFNEMKRVRRKGINQALKKGVICKELDLNDDRVLRLTYHTIHEVYQRIKLPMPEYSFFKIVQRNLGDMLIGLGLYVGDELIGVRLALVFNNLVYDWYAGAKNDRLQYRPNDVLPWELMKWGMNNGYDNFDFGGAGKPGVPYGVRDFKMKFGGELVEFGRYEKVHKPLLMAVGKLGFKMKQLLKK